MKKLFVLLLVAAMCFSLAACGKKIETNLVFDFFDESFSWTMTTADAEAFMLKDQNSAAAVSTEEMSGGEKIRLTDGYYSFFFDADGTLKYVKIMMQKPLLNTLTQTYGECREKNEKLYFYYWYGTLNGEKTELTLMEDFLGGCDILEFSPMD